MPSCPAANMSLPAVMVKNEELILRHYDNTDLERSE
jgi:hypothetical protein